MGEIVRDILVRVIEGQVGEIVRDILARVIEGQVGEIVKDILVRVTGGQLCDIEWLTNVLRGADRLKDRRTMKAIVRQMSLDSE